MIFVNVHELLTNAKDYLPESTTSRLDVEILLAYVCYVDRAFLYTNPQLVLTEGQQDQFQNLLNRRKKGEPIAYLVGSKDFWSLSLIVACGVLVPRPETEVLVETILAIYPASESIKVADLGTGCGAIALALATERPHWRIVATDKSPFALKNAKKNAVKLGISQVAFYQGDWCKALTESDFDIIVSNPPYLSLEEWEKGMLELKFEPVEALVAEKSGVGSFEAIIEEAKKFLRPQGMLILEHGYQQGEVVRGMMEANGYNHIFTRQDLAGLERMTIGQKE